MTLLGLRREAAGQDIVSGPPNCSRTRIRPGLRVHPAQRGPAAAPQGVLDPLVCEPMMSTAGVGDRRETGRPG